MSREMADQYTVVGVFADRRSAEGVVAALERNGISRDLVRIDAEGRSGSGTATTEHESGFFGWLFGHDNPDIEDRPGYESAMGRGNFVVSVSGPQATLERAADVMNAHDPIDIDQRADIPTERGRTAAHTTGQPASIPVVEEELQVGKRAVQRGRVRVYSRVIEQPVEEQVHLRDEQVRVDRRRVDRPLDPAEAAKMKDQSFEVTETTEEPIVRKQARVKEEVTVSKEARDRTETVRDTVRRTEVHVDKSGEGGRSGMADDQEFRQHYTTHYASSGLTYDAMDPAYRYGSQFADDPRYGGKSWADVEPHFRASYQQQYPNSNWDRVKDAIRYGWERATLRRRAA